MRGGGLAAGALCVAAAGTLAAVGLLAAPQTAAPEACADVRAQGAVCSTIRVPENRTTGKGRTIDVRVVVLPASGPERLPDPIFHLAGGPGQAASDFAGAYVRSPLRTRRDQVFVDQRGTGGSNALKCSVYRPEDEARGVFVDFLPVERVRECRTLLERSADLTQYTTAASVADLEDVRRALGYGTINLSGGSYGTRLALEYVRAHPAKVRSVVLEGAISPGSRVPAGFGREAQRVLDRILAECGQSAPCAAAFPRVARDASDVFARLAKAPAKTRFSDSPVEVTMTRDNVAEAVRYLTYSTRDASRLPFVLHRASQGDFTPIADSLRNRRRGRIVDALYLSITCAEDVPFLPPDAAARERGTYLGDYRIVQQQRACREWPRGSVPPWHGTPVKASVPVLLITGLLDPATPPAMAEEVARSLPNSLHVKVPSAGHGLFGVTGLECIETLRQRFVEQGSVRGLDPGCAASMRRAGFFTGS